MHTFTEENYLKAIFKLSNESETVVSTNALASKLGTSAASVSDMLRKLSDKKLISYKKYQGVTLTTKGTSVAVQIVRRHRLWEMFLVEKLNFKWDEVHDIAEELEHIKSEKLIAHLDEFLGFPEADPHGDPIPDQNGKFGKLKTKQLTSADQGSKVKMCGVIDHTPSFLQYLDSLGIAIGDTIQVQEISDYDNSLKVKVNKKAGIFLSFQVGKNIVVK